MEECGQHERGYHLIGIRDNSSEYQHWRFHDTIDLITTYEQPAYLNVEMEYSDELRSDNSDRMEGIKAARLVAAVEKKKSSCQMEERPVVVVTKMALHTNYHFVAIILFRNTL
jgi:hypothetical protein